jgi:hypothetical protein
VSAPDKEPTPGIICSGCGSRAHVGRPCPPEVWEEDTVKIEPGDPLYPAAITDPGPPVGPDQVVACVAERLGVKLELLASSNRLQRAVDARHVAALVLRWAGYRPRRIGLALGGRTRETIIQALAKAQSHEYLCGVAGEVAVRLGVPTPWQRVAS